MKILLDKLANVVIVVSNNANGVTEMNGLDIIARIQAMPDRFAVVTRFANGDTRDHKVKTRGQADNYAIGERRKIGKSLINRDTGATVHVVAVDIVAL